MQRKLAGVPKIRQLPLNELEFVSRMQFIFSNPSIKKPYFMDGLRKISVPSTKSRHFMDRTPKTDIPSMKKP